MGTRVGRASTADRGENAPSSLFVLSVTTTRSSWLSFQKALKIEFIKDLSSHTSRRTPDNQSELKLSNRKPRTRVQNSLDESARQHSQGRVCCDAFGTKLFPSFFLKAGPPTVYTTGPPDPDPPRRGGFASFKCPGRDPSIATISSALAWKESAGTGASGSRPRIQPQAPGLLGSPPWG